MTDIYEILIAPPGATCDICFTDCAGEPCEVTTVDGRERYSHVDLDACLEKWETRGNAERETRSETLNAKRL